MRSNKINKRTIIPFGDIVLGSIRSSGPIDVSIFNQAKFFLDIDKGGMAPGEKIVFRLFDLREEIAVNAAQRPRLEQTNGTGAVRDYPLSIEVFGSELPAGRTSRPYSFPMDAPYALVTVELPAFAAGVQPKIGVDVVPSFIG